jgi:hypothetical protein
LISENWFRTGKYRDIIRIKFVGMIHLRTAKGIILIGRIKLEDKDDLDRIEKPVGMKHGRLTLTELSQSSEQDNG